LGDFEKIIIFAIIINAIIAIAIIINIIIMRIENPFLVRGYVSGHYFCDRKIETEDLVRELTNSNNVTLIAPRRIGKTGLILHCFEQEKIKKNYNTFLVDILDTKTPSEFVQRLGKTILATLKPKGKKALQYFLETVRSLQPYISFDVVGNPSWGLGVGDVASPETSLDEIFSYLNSSDKPNIVAIDEFQAVVDYKGSDMEAILRNYVQHCHNANFIFSGSHRSMMTDIFLASDRPFYESTSIKSLSPLKMDVYCEFAENLFEEYSKKLLPETFKEVYNSMDGITWYIQRMLNRIFYQTAVGEETNENSAKNALNSILDDSSFSFSEILYRLPTQQKQVLLAIATEGDARNVTSAEFTKKYMLTSPSSVQSAIKGLVDKGFVTYQDGAHMVSDKFFAEWLRRL